MTARALMSNRRTAAVGGVLAALVLVSGCSGSSSDKAGGATTSASPSPTASVAVQPTFRPIPTLAKQVGARKDVTVSSCAESGDAWVAKGSLTNASGSAADYVIVVSMLDSKGGTKGINWTRKNSVASKDKTDWQVSVPVTGSGLRCVLRVTRGSTS